MIRKSISAYTAPPRNATAAMTHPATVRVTFELPSCTWACRIFVCGDFNEWSKEATPMRQERDGVWRAIVELPYGKKFCFRYLIDGNWQTDYHADGWSDSGYGSENSIIDTSIVTEEISQESLPLVQVVSIPASVPETNIRQMPGSPEMPSEANLPVFAGRAARRRTTVVRHAA